MDAWQVRGGGVSLSLGNATVGLSLIISDGAGSNLSVATDPACAARLASSPASEHFVAVVAEAGPLIARFFVDGVLCDGGGVRTGWAWIPMKMGAPKGSGTLRVGSGLVKEGAVFGRALRTSEVVAQWRAVRA